MGLELWVLFISHVPKGLFHWVLNNMADGEESLTPSSPVAWTFNKFPANAIWWQVMCGIQYAVLFIYFPGVAFLLVIYVLLCMICFWDLWHGVRRVFGRQPRLKRSHGSRIMWQDSAPSMSISVYCIFFCCCCCFWTYSSKWGMVMQILLGKVIHVKGNLSERFCYSQHVFSKESFSYMKCIFSAWSCCCHLEFLIT